MLAAPGTERQAPGAGFALAGERMRTRKEFAFIIHGSRAELPAVRHLVDWVRGKGHRVRPRVTWEKGDAEELAREMADKGVDTVVALGGDGTINEVVNGLDGRDVPLGIIPIGTANDFARQVGIPLDADHAMDVILRRKPRRMDTGELNGRRFLNVSTAGIGAEATAETPADAKESLGPLAYAITGMRKLRDMAPRRAKFTGPGFSYDGEFMLFAVGNARVTGGGTAITPFALVTDGLLDLCIVMGVEARSDFMRLVLSVRRGEHVDDPRVSYVQLPELKVESRQPIAVNVDGESQELRRLHYRARPCDLLIHLPRLPEEPADVAPRL
jgi:diacylglycerol kinase (ATP)